MSCDFIGIIPTWKSRVLFENIGVWIFTETELGLLFHVLKLIIFIYAIVASQWLETNFPDSLYLEMRTEKCNWHQNTEWMFISISASIVWHHSASSQEWNDLHISIADFVQGIPALWKYCDLITYSVGPSKGTSCSANPAVLLSAWYNIKVSFCVKSLLKMW